MGSDRAVAPATERPDGQDHEAASAVGGGVDLSFAGRAGLAWRDLPAEFGPWQSVWKRHAKFSKDGTWDKVLLALQTQADAAGQIDWNVSVDSGDRPGASARRDRCEVAADGHRSHRGLYRITKIR